MLNFVREALTFDDVLIVPSRSSILPAETNLKSFLTNSISLNIPVVSSAMDTVTESNLAIALAQEGGVGFIHKNMSLDQQINEVRRVKRYESGIVTNPQCVTPDMTLLQLKELTSRSGFAGYPVVMVGTNELVGIVTRRDVRFVSDLSNFVFSVMTPKERLVTVLEKENRGIVLDKMHDKRVEKILLVDSLFRLKGMITAKDFEKAERKPYACKDDYGRLCVGAAIGVGEDYKERVEGVVDAGLDVLLVDSSHGHSEKVLNCIKTVRNMYPNLSIVGGNVVTQEGALELVESGASAVKVGVGPGSICTTRIVTGVGIPQITAISDVAEALKNTNIPIIADGGIRFSGDIAKAIAAGAHCVMIGSLLAGTEESPGDIEFYQGRSFKTYRGMGSLGAMSQGSSDRYFQQQDSVATHKLVPEGIEGRVPYRGKLETIIHQLMGGLRSCMGLTGCVTINDLRMQARFVRVSYSGIQESHVHDVMITKESPNYRLR
ncbi:IMP dehydrogenase [Blochmannia endosymbiont of Camponotus sp. C-046]|uniref:IMP dehydrogenase n=1 Tax=Blochmannia endosymbiont of Camponotus sp. C-046 TaxID=2945589 RepID=UPI002023D63E|nr:IMP dehydrogenase [Blochmannia endosymbiont of Camponotus sp. C-046]URJ28783.1 IMP dehydrogenase [Blochmannia endosymbiont of Camponotus sp. C-046]